MNMTVKVNDSTLLDAMAFVWLEADLLDQADFDGWLKLWTPDARYVVPVEPGETDFENSLNYAYDDHELREKRVERILSGFSISASPVARTARSASRFRILSDDGKTVELRCMQHLVEFRRSRERHYTADLEYRLVRGPSGFLIDQKVIRLINADEPLGGISYIL